MESLCRSRLRGDCITAPPATGSPQFSNLDVPANRGGGVEGPDEREGQGGIIVELWQLAGVYVIGVFLLLGLLLIFIYM